MLDFATAERRLETKVQAIRVAMELWSSLGRKDRISSRTSFGSEDAMKGSGWSEGSRVSSRRLGVT